MERANTLCTQIAKSVYKPVKKPANAFKYHEAPDASFPQLAPVKPLDFRSEALPTAGFATIGNRRKFAPGSVAKQVVVPLDMGGSVRGTFASMTEDVAVLHSDVKIKPIVPLKISKLPKTKIVAVPRRDRSSRKAERGSAK